ncbi:Arylsulfatase [Novipirellula aureliae]|uniref:Arylsulfatase n=1 Tax=Novipirellula aureliae TaxID=2527966 RepID=A0A5C6DVA9_9BACT|nr:sulfatase [Novipirellula aureliae]TWU39016.1 Arylsulfatase [Novipirellula aureliae]
MIPTFVRFTLIGFTFSFLGAVSVGAEPSEETSPNVLFIAIDDLRPELGCYGSTIAKSPNINRLAESGVTFTRAYCQQAVCNPSRASLMTGLRPDTIRVWDLSTDFRTAKPDAVTLTQQFMKNGYHAVGIGKIFHNDIQDPGSWSEPKLNIDGYPFDPDAVYRAKENVAWLEQRKQELIAEGDTRRIDPFGKWYLKHVATENVDLPDDAYFDGAQTSVAIEKMGKLASGDKPFFLAVGYYRPHLPFNVPKRYWDMYDRDKIRLAENRFLPKNAPIMAVNTAREIRGYTDFEHQPRPHEGSFPDDQARLLKHGYLASVSYIDAQVGRLLDTLKDLNLDKNTIVVLWGDHGWKLGEHNSWCKMTNYEIDTHVPLIVRAPDAKENGKQCDRLVEFVDVYPTLCELADVPLREELEGNSFAPLLEKCDLPWKEAVFSQFLRDGIWIAPDNVAYMGRCIRTERYRYVEWKKKNDNEIVARELYDLQLDPQENNNVADQKENREVVVQLAAQLNAGWKSVVPKQAD